MFVSTDLPNQRVVLDGAIERLLNYHLLAKSEGTMCVREYKLQIPYGVVETEGASIVVS